MKDITDYFTSPNKGRKSSEMVDTKSSDTPSSNHVVNIGDGLQESTYVEANRDKTSKKKKKKRRKPTDPEVRDVAELFSNNLSLISPNTSGTKVKTPPAEKKNQSRTKISITCDDTKSSDLIVSENNSYLGDQDNRDSKIDSKVNAFQFLMNSRNNVIGQNIDGVVLKEQDKSINTEKEKLEARKNVFKTWADRKGASKRKREEDIDKCINLKMKKRAKRLKKLLQRENNQEDSEDFIAPVKVKRKVKRLSSTESENSNENIDNKCINAPSIKIFNVMEENAQDTVISNFPSPSKKHQYSDQKSLLNFLGITSKEKKDNVIELFDEEPKTVVKEVIKIKMFTPKAVKKKFNDSIAQNNSEVIDITDELTQENIKNKKHRRKKNKVKDFGENSTNENKLNDSAEDFCSPGTTNIKKIMKINSKKQKGNYKAKLEITIPNTNVDSNKDIIKVSNKNILQNVEPINGSKKAINKKCLLDDTDNTHKENSSTVVVEVNLENTPEQRILRKRNVTIDITKSEKKDKGGTPIVKRNKMCSKDESIEQIDLLENEDKEDRKNMGFSIKVAPVFLKATPKPKVDPEIIEAKRKFLFSGIPESLKKTVEKQRSIEEKEYDIFPTVSHIQQKCESKFWTLSNPGINYAASESLSSPLNTHNLKCQNLIMRVLPYKINLDTRTENIKHMKSVVQKIKAEHPHYPVYKVFRHICEKGGKSFLEGSSSSHRSSKKCSKKLKQDMLDIKGTQSESVLKEHEMWTEKYKPRSSEEILGNYNSVNQLKKWLETWMNYSEEINVRRRKRTNSNSESEFESTDCDSRDSVRLPGNTVILYGPCGSGKTSAVYAIANELSFNVIEFNASTKRTGKRLLQDLQEATQSHQVKKNKANPLSKFVGKPSQDVKNKKIIDTAAKSKCDDKKSDQKDAKKMCILLLEDIDLIFEQDEGFLSSLSQLIVTSKRPIILTTTDNSPPHVQRFINQYECIAFMPLSLQCLSIWLQIVCLVEGMLVDKNDLGNLLEYNKGDIRKTLLEMQFWSQSGGQLEKTRIFPLKSDGSIMNVPYLKAPDDESQFELGEDETNNMKQFIHKYCLGSFEIFRVNEEFCIPQNVDLGLLWWNMPNLLDIPSSATGRLNRQKLGSKTFQETQHENSSENVNSRYLNEVSELYDSLILTDCLFTKINSHNSNEPVIPSWSLNVRDSSELDERKEDCDGMAVDLVHDLGHTLVNGHITHCRRIRGAVCTLNMALPDSSERRWRSNQHMCEDFLKEPIPLSYHLSRKSVAVDYLPFLRDVARSEEKRAASNTKRGNRFRHYLKDLNIQFKQNTCKLACNILNIE